MPSFVSDGQVDVRGCGVKRDATVGQNVTVHFDPVLGLNAAVQVRVGWFVLEPVAAPMFVHVCFCVRVHM